MNEKEPEEKKKPFAITLLIGEFREPLVNIDSLNPFYPFETVMERFREMARIIFSLRPEVTALELVYQEVIFKLTPALAQKAEPDFEIDF